MMLSRRGKIEIAADEMRGDSIRRSTELAAKTVDVSAKLQAFLAPLSKSQEALSQDQKDTVAMLTAQIRYLQVMQFEEVVKRREFEEIRDLAEVERIEDEETSNL